MEAKHILNELTFLRLSVEVRMEWKRDLESGIVVLYEIKVDGGDETFFLIQNLARLPWKMRG